MPVLCVANPMSYFISLHICVELLKLQAEYESTLCTPMQAAARGRLVFLCNVVPLSVIGFIDDVIMPNATRRHLINDLKILSTKTQYTHNKKHGNIPL